MHIHPNAIPDYVAIKAIAMMLQLLSIATFHFLATTMIIATI
jgi:hypothetical protein